MKYVSPIYEVETIETEDIMSASYVANQLGIQISGETSSLTSVTLTDDKGDAVEDQTPGNQTATGVSIGINFGSLFGN